MGAGHFQAASGPAQDRQGPPRRGPWFAAMALVVMLGVGVAGVRGAAAARHGHPFGEALPAAVAATLCGQAGWPETPVEGGAYVVQNDEWNSTAAECITTDGHAQFTVASSAISEPPAVIPAAIRRSTVGAARASAPRVTRCPSGSAG